jgi:hypothetical protein
LDVISVIKIKLIAFQKQQKQTLEVIPPGVEKCLSVPNIFQLPAKGECLGATAVDRVMVFTQNGFRGVMKPERVKLVQTLADMVILQPDIPTVQEVRGWVPLHSLFVETSRVVSTSGCSSSQSGQSADPDLDAAMQASLNHVLLLSPLSLMLLSDTLPHVETRTVFC